MKRTGGDIVERSLRTFGLRDGGEGVFAVSKDTHYVEGAGAVGEGTDREVVMVYISSPWSCVVRST